MGAWSTITMPGARYLAGVIYRPSTKLLHVIGGYGPSLSREVQHWAYDTTTGTWDTLAPMPDNGGDEISAAYESDGKIFLLFRNKAWSYDPVANSWNIYAGSLPGSAYHYQPATMQRTDTNNMYLLGGDSTYLSTYYPASSSWAVTSGYYPNSNDNANPNDPKAVEGSDGAHYFVMGTTSQLYRWSFSTFSVTSLGSIDGELYASVAPDFTQPGRVLVPPRYEVRSTSAYDPATDSLVTGVLPDVPAGLPLAFYAHRAAVDPDGALFLVGGRAPNSADPMDTILVYRANQLPDAPELQSLAAGQTIDRANVARLSWSFSDPDPGDSQSAFELRYRPVGGTWTTVQQTTPNGYYDAPAGAFAAADHEWQVRTADQEGAYSPWSSVGYFTAADQPGAPNIVAPVAGQTIATSSYNVEWSAPGQDTYQVQVLAGAEVIHDSGATASTGVRSYTVPLPDNQVERTIRVRVQLDGLWSPWASVTVQVSYTLPAAPLVSLVADQATGSLQVLVDDATPAGTQPTVTHHDVLVDDGLGAGPVRLAADLPVDATWTYWTPRSGRDYAGHVQVVTYGDNTTRLTTVAT